ncbi:MAG: sugar phosphate nucleotidyltransferase [Candidatus Aenigmatarchaeota archaeon]
MRKVRISMTISPDLLKRIDSIVDGAQTRSRSEAIETVMSKFLEVNKTAVFLGGGDIERLLVGGKLKPLMEIGERTLIEHNIEMLKKSGFRRIFIVGKSELIGECFKVLGSGGRHGVKIDYLEEQRTLGNAKTLQIAEPHINAPFLVLPVDNFFDFDLNYLSTAHMQGGGIATLAVQSGRETRMDLGVVEMVGNRIISYEEAPKNPKTFLTATFIGMYSPEIFEYIPRGNARWVLQTDVFQKLIKEGKMNGCIVPGFYINVRDAGDVSLARDFLKKK